MGYDLFRFDETVDNTHICVLCVDSVVKNPVMIRQCKHLYCSECIEEWFQFSESSKTCPKCRVEFTRNDLVEPSVEVLNVLNNLHIKCQFNSIGCETIVVLKDVQLHENNCSYNTSLAIQCACGLYFTEQVIRDHELVCKACQTVENFVPEEDNETVTVDETAPQIVNVSTPWTESLLESLKQGIAECGKELAKSPNGRDSANASPQNGRRHGSGAPVGGPRRGSGAPGGVPTGGPGFWLRLKFKLIRISYYIIVNLDNIFKYRKIGAVAGTALGVGIAGLLFGWGWIPLVCGGITGLAAYFLLKFIFSKLRNQLQNCIQEIENHLHSD